MTRHRLASALVLSLALALPASDGIAQAAFRARVLAIWTNAELEQTRVEIPVHVGPPHSERGPGWSTLPETRWRCAAWSRPSTTLVLVQCRYGSTGASVDITGNPCMSGPSPGLTDGERGYSLSIVCE